MTEGDQHIVSGHVAPGRPRDPSIEPRVLNAAVQEIAEQGIAGFSMNRVAARAEVDKRSIYNRWKDRRALLTDALSTLVADVQQAATGSLRTDLEQLMPTVAAVFTSPRIDILNRALREAKQDPEIYREFQRDLLDHAGAIVEHAFREAARRGELRPDVDPAWATDAFFGLMMARGMIRHRDHAPNLDAQEQQQILDYVIRMVGRS
jgi:AcrR family transcriptional regulator